MGQRATLECENWAITHTSHNYHTFDSRLIKKIVLHSIPTFAFKHIEHCPLLCTFLQHSFLNWSFGEEKNPFAIL